MIEKLYSCYKSYYYARFRASLCSKKKGTDFLKPELLKLQFQNFYWKCTFHEDRLAQFPVTFSLWLQQILKNPTKLYETQNILCLSIVWLGKVANGLHIVLHLFDLRPETHKCNSVKLHISYCRIRIKLGMEDDIFTFAILHWAHIHSYYLQKSSYFTVQSV